MSRWLGALVLAFAFTSSELPAQTFTLGQQKHAYTGSPSPGTVSAPSARFRSTIGVGQRGTGGAAVGGSTVEDSSAAALGVSQMPR